MSQSMILERNDLRTAAYGLPRAILTAGGVVVALYGLFAIIEYSYFVKADPLALKKLYLTREILTTILAVVVFSGSLLGTSPSLLARQPSTHQLWNQGLKTDPRQRIVHYCQWFVVMRWIALAVAGTMVLIVVGILELLPHAVLAPFVILLGILMASNLFYVWLMQRSYLRHLLVLQIYVDLLILICLLHFSGGIENPFSLLMILHVIISGIVLNQRQCYLVAWITSVLFMLMALGEYSQWLAHYTLLILPHYATGMKTQHAAHQLAYVASCVGLHTAVLFLCGYFVSTLAQRLRLDEQQLADLADQALTEQHLLDQALDTTHTGLRVVDRQNMTIRWANEKWNQWFNAESDNNTQMHRQLNSDQSPARQTLSDGQVRVTELEQVALADATHTNQTMGTDLTTKRVFQITSAPLQDAGGTIHQVVELAQEITAQKKAQAQLIRAGQLAAVGELAGQVAHEVNNPIAIIATKARLQLSNHRNEMSNKTAGEFEKIVDLSDRVARIAQGLLSYCRPSGAARVLLDIRTPVHQVMAVVAERIASKDCTIIDNLPASLPHVRANAQELEQVFLNLFLNSLDAMPRGGRLTISASKDTTQQVHGKPCVSVQVHDTGSGVPIEHQQHLFELFYTTKQAGKGTGLGLSICQGIINSHGGEIDIQSQPGQGACFTIRLPIENQEPAEVIRDG